eukprot:NODE_3418_length_981_cov_13.045064_g3140_i0.p1 GENE.NODE_3418_length_981_cov_13.045064_g3140_i0~~NODE_3418_length_981_cov_13.045064_g3140_i0.p1  ORF type:complete len:259 (-),score=44.14 NODE_3418_length_981_cov_13.045064_g3140_i0:205-921(-)
MTTPQYSSFEPRFDSETAPVTEVSLRPRPPVVSPLSSPPPLTPTQPPPPSPTSSESSVPPELTFDIHEVGPRNVMIKRLCGALLHGKSQTDGQPAGLETADHAKSIAVDIEQVIYTTMGQSNAEKARLKFNQLHANLRSNIPLCEGLLSGEISPERFVSMKAEELGSDELLNKRLEVRDYAKKAALSEWGEKRVTDQFKCQKCGERKTTYFQMQTRSADEPMTTFVTCVNCGNAWKFC